MGGAAKQRRVVRAAGTGRWVDWDIMTDEKEYGSLGRLAPEWDGDERERNLTADDIYERFFGWVEEV